MRSRSSPTVSNSYLNRRIELGERPNKRLRLALLPKQATAFVPQ
jgi:hypothetical protein